MSKRVQVLYTFRRKCTISKKYPHYHTGCIKKKGIIQLGMSLCVNYWVYERNFCIVMKVRVSAVE